MNSKDGLTLLAVTLLLLIVAMLGDGMTRRNVETGWRVICPARGSGIDSLVKWTRDLRDAVPEIPLRMQPGTAIR